VAPIIGSVGGSNPALVIRDDVSAIQIRAFFESQLAEQEALAMAHLGDSYWTDSYTGHNVGKDELAATRVLRAISLDPAAEGHDDPELYARWLLQHLEDAGHRYRSDHSDPDGYGIATIGMIERNLRKFCYA